jgi:FkbM family methyltransferase
VLRRRNALQQLRKLPGLRWLLRALDFPVWRRVRGTSGPVRVRWLQHMSYYLPSHGPEPEISALMIALVGCLPVRTFLDVGANFGYYTWLLADHAGSELEIHMFEPDDRNQRLVRRTLQRRGSVGVTFHPIALSADDGSASFYRDLDTGHRGSLVHESNLAGAVLTETRRLDSVITSPVALTLVKIDVEGGEEDVLAGAAGVLETAPVIILECYHRDVDAAWRRVSSLPGYTVYDAMTGGPATPTTSNFWAVPSSVSDEATTRVLAERDRLLRLPKLTVGNRTS